MTNAFSSMEYPHWLIVAGAVLLMLGFVGLALRQRAVEAELNDMASRAVRVLRPSSLRPKVLIARRSLRSRKGIGGRIKTAVPRNR